MAASSQISEHIQTPQEIELVSNMSEFFVHDQNTFVLEPTPTRNLQTFCS